MSSAPIGRTALLQKELHRVDGVNPAERAAKHVKMAGNPFLFFRGSAQLFYADLASGLLQLPKALSTVPLTMVVGDCHMANFGFITEEGAFGRQVIFTPNDFDDACIGLAGWDLLRFCTSLVLCVQYCEGASKGLYSSERNISGKPVVHPDSVASAIERFLLSYAQTCEALIAHPDAYNHAVISDFPSGHILAKRHQKALDRGFGGKDFLTKSSLGKAVDLTAETLRFRQRPSRYQRLSEQDYAQLLHVFEPFVDDNIVDIVARINAGTGSVNMQRYYLLVGPGPRAKAEDLALYHLVEVKQQRHAAPLYHFPDLSPVNRLDPAHLTVRCQQRMQRDPDLVLDEVVWRDAHWLLRSRHHARVGVDPEHIAIGKKACAGGFAAFAASCGSSLAMAHGRADRRSAHFEKSMLAVIPQVIPQLTQASQDYAQQVNADCAALNQLMNP